jgi:hypothetical protein
MTRQLFKAYCRIDHTLRMTVWETRILKLSLSNSLAPNRLGSHTVLIEKYRNVENVVNADPFSTCLQATSTTLNTLHIRPCNHSLDILSCAARDKATRRRSSHQYSTRINTMDTYSISCKLDSTWHEIIMRLCCPTCVGLLGIALHGQWLSPPNRDGGRKRGSALVVISQLCHRSVS